MTAPVLTRMRWWHLDEVLPIEQVVYPDERWSARAFWSELGQVDTRHDVVAVEDDAVVGYAGLCDYPDEAFVQTIAVSPACQGRGIGALLLQDLLAEADRRRKAPVALEVRADNAPAQRLYARHGFRRTSVRRGYYQPSGTDAWVMQRG